MNKHSEEKVIEIVMLGNDKKYKKRDVNLMVEFIRIG